MSGSALLFSAIPVAMDILDTGDAPMTVGAGIVIGYTVFTHLGRYGHRGFTPVSYRQIFQRCLENQVSLPAVSTYLCLAAFSALGYVFFAWSTSYVDTAVSSSMFEFWPIVWILVFLYVDRSRRGRDEYRVLPVSTGVLMVLAACAMVLVIFSTADPNAVASGTSLPLIGAVIGILAPILAGMGAFTFSFADRLLYGRSKDQTDNWNSNTSFNSDPERTEESVVHAGMVLGRLFITPIVIALAVSDVGFQAAILSHMFLGGVFIGFFLHGPAGFLARKAHLVSSRREIIALQYLAPVVALMWLWLFTEIEVFRIDFLIFGTVSVVALNMLINADPERKRTAASVAITDSVHSEGSIQERYSLKALVVSLLAFGMFMYFREEILVAKTLGWSDNGSYWGVLGLASTVFALLLAFRLTRIESLLLTEDNRTFGIIRRIEMIPDELLGISGSEYSKDSLLKYIRQLNRASRLNDYRAAYNGANIVFQHMILRLSSGELVLSSEEKREISEIRAELDVLAHGRQQAREFAERMALWMIGVIIVALSMGVPVEVSDWARLLSETFVVLLSSIVVYLLFHLADMRRSRSDELLIDKEPKWNESFPDALYVRFRDDADARWQRIFAGLVVVGVVVTIVIALASIRLTSM